VEKPLVKVLIIHTYGIGDIIMAIPMVKYLKKIHPEFEIDLFTTNKGSASLMESQPFFDHIYFSPRSMKGLYSILHFLRKKKYDYSIVSSISNASIPLKHGLITLFINANNRFGEYINYPVPFYTKTQKFSQSVHRVISNIGLIKLIVKDIIDRIDDIYPELALTDTLESFSKEWLDSRCLSSQRMLLFHVGSSKGGIHRRWGEDKFVDLIMKLQKETWQTVIISGEEELAESRYVADRTHSEMLCHHSLIEVFSVMKRSYAFINADSGLGHLASAAGIKVFSLFGPGDEQKTSPYAKESYVIRNETSKCQKCLYPVKGCTMECMKGLSVESVYQEIKSRL